MVLLQSKGTSLKAESEPAGAKTFMGMPPHLLHLLRDVVGAAHEGRELLRQAEQAAAASIAPSSEASPSMTPLTADELAGSAMKLLSHATLGLLEERPKMVEHREDFALVWREELRQFWGSASAAGAHSATNTHAHGSEPWCRETLAEIFVACAEVCLLRSARAPLAHTPLEALQYGRFACWTDAASLPAAFSHAAALAMCRRPGEARAVMRADVLPAVARGAATLSADESAAWMARCQALWSELRRLERHYGSARFAARVIRGEVGRRWPVGVCFTGPIETYRDGHKGRGLRTTRAVHAGETLLIERGYVSSRCGDDAHFWYELLQALDADEATASLYLDLFPSPDVPVEDFLAPDIAEPFTAAMQDQTRRFTRAYPRVYKHLTPQQTRDMVWKKYLNAYQLFDDSIGLYATFALLNHDCDANTVRFFLPDGMALLIAARDLAAGEEVSVHYCPLSHPRPCRHKRLLEALCFHCACDRCAARGPKWGGGAREAALTALRCPHCGETAALRVEDVRDELTEDTSQRLHYRCAGAGAAATGACRQWCRVLESPEDMYDEVLDTVGAALETDCATTRRALREKLDMLDATLPAAGGKARLALLCGLCKLHAAEGDADAYEAALTRLEASAAAFPDPQACTVVANMLMTASVRWGRDLHDRELRLLSLWGFSLPLLRTLWDWHDPISFQRFFYCAG